MRQKNWIRQGAPIPLFIWLFVGATIAVGTLALSPLVEALQKQVAGDRHDEAQFTVNPLRQAYVKRRSHVLDAKLERLIGSGRYDEALAMLERRRQRHPDNLNLARRHVSLLLALEQPHAARAEAARLRQLDPSSAEAAWLLARALDALDDHRQVPHLLRTALRLEGLTEAEREKVRADLALRLASSDPEETLALLDGPGRRLGLEGELAWTRAHALHGVGRHAEAATLFAELAENTGSPARRREALLSRTESLLARKEFGAAIAALQAAMGPTPEVQSIARQAQLLVADNRPAEAAERFMEAAARAHEPTTRAVFLRAAGQAEWAAGRPVAALGQFEQAQALHPTSAGAAQVIEAADAAGRHDLVAQLLGGANRPAQVRRRCHALEAAGRTQDALSCWHRLSQRQPDDVALLDHLATLAQSLGDHQATLDYLAAAARRDPTAPRHLDLGRRLLNAGLTDDAEEHFHAAFALDPRLAGPVYAEHLIARGRNGPAAAVIEAALDAGLTGAEARNARLSLGHRFAAVDAWEKAAQHWRAAGADRGSIDERLHLALALTMTQRPEDALALTQPIDVRRLDREQRAIFAEARGRALLDLDRPAEAESSLAMLVSARGGVEDHRLLAEAAIATGRAGAAETALRRAIASHPGTAAFHGMLGYLLLDQGRREEAAEHLAFARRNDLDPALDADLGHLLAALGRPDEAGTHLATAIEGLRLRASETDDDMDPQHLEDLQGALADSRRRFALLFNDSFCFGGQNCLGGAITGGPQTVLAQGSVEARWRPSFFYLRGGRRLEATARLLWARPPDTARVSRKEMTAAVGLRAKPFGDSDFWLAAERLQQLTDRRDSGWLLRASWGWQKGDIWSDRDSPYHPLSLYAEVGQRLDARRETLLYAEGRYAIAVLRGEQHLLQPSAFLRAQRSFTDETRSGRIEAGIGLGFRWRFGADDLIGYRHEAGLSLEFGSDLVSFDGSRGQRALLRLQVRF